MITHANAAPGVPAPGELETETENTGRTASIWDRTIRRRPPPYGRRLADVLARPATWPGYIGTSKDGRRLTVWVLVGAAAWSLAREWEPQRRAFLVCPPDAGPADFDWRMLAGHDPILLRPCGEVDGDHIRRLVTAMMRDGVRRVLRTDSGARYLARPQEVRHAA